MVAFGVLVGYCWVTRQEARGKEFTVVDVERLDASLDCYVVAVYIGGE